MSEQPTLRVIHERCETRHSPFHDRSPSTWCSYCSQEWPCADYSDAVAALNLLNEARFFDDDEVLELGCYWASRLIPDPLSCPEVPAETRDGETT